MTRPAGVLCAVRGSAERSLVRALDEDRRLEVTRRCADVAELLAAAAAGLGQVAVVSAGVPGLDRTAIESLHASGVWVVAVTDVPAGWSADRVRLLGVDAAVPAEGPTEAAQAVVSAVHQLLADGAQGERPGDSRGPVGHPGEPPTAPDPGSPGTAAVVEGALVTVWGPTGAPGRTTVALTLAAELAERAPADSSGGALLIDADTYGGTVAQLVGLLDEAPGIAAAARAAGTGRLDPPSLAALTPVLDGGLRVLTGISRADRWLEIPAASLEIVFRTARLLAAWTVVDCGFCLESDEALSFDTRAPRRNAATLCALAEADVVVVVGGGDPIGLQRLVRSLADLDDLAVTKQRVVVVNRVRASASGHRPREAIRDALRRYAGVAEVHFVPDDPGACDGAVLMAKTLVEHAPTSPARRALTALAGQVLSLAAAATAH